MDIETQLLTAIGHRLRRNLINVFDLANISLAISQGSICAVDRQDLVHIKVSASKSLSLIDTILAVAHFNEDRQLWQVFNPDQVIQSALSQMSNGSDGNERPVTFSVGPVLGELLGSPVALESAILALFELFCLISHPAQVYVSSDHSKEALRLRVSDTVDYDNLVMASIQRVFGEDDNLDTLMKFLACVRAIYSMRGSVEIKSRPDQRKAHGFSLTVPYHGIEL